MRVIKILFYISTLFFIVVSCKQIFFNTSLHYDEVGNYLPAWNYHHYGKYAFTVENPNKFNPTSPFITLGTYVGQILTLSVSWIGKHWNIARIWIFIHSIGLLLFVYSIARNNFSKSIALLSSAILMLNNLFILYSTRIMGEMPALMGCFMGFWAYWQGKEKNERFWYGIAFLGFQISILSKEYFAVLIGLTLLLVWVFQEKCRLSAVFYLGLTLPTGILITYFLFFERIEIIQLYLKERAIYQIEFFAFRLSAIQWIMLKPLILIGYLAHTIRVYTQKRSIDTYLWIFQSIYLILFIISIGFERFGTGLIIIPSIYLAEFLYGVCFVPAINKTQKIILYGIFTILVVQKSPYLLWKKSEKMPVLPIYNYKNKLVHTPELSIVPLLIEQPYQLPRYPPASFKKENYDENKVKIVQNEYIKADILILGEYAYTEYSSIYRREIIEKNFEKVYTSIAYEIWIKK